ncbi:hypothetical protein NB713_003112 [Xanthomonas sacchari]|nr:hypothetical protein [Xanthomonas sacchari]
MLGELDGVVEQVQQDLPHPRGVAARGDLRRHGVVQGEGEVAAARHRPHHGLQFGDQPAQVERLLFQFQAPGLDPRQVQRIVDQTQQVRARVADRFGVAALPGVQRRGQQQFAHAQHPGHRRAHLVAERGQEAGLGQRGLLGHLLLVHRQLPGGAPAQPPPVQVREQPQRQHRQHRQPGDAPGAAPPRRQDAEVQADHVRPDLVGGTRLHLQGVVARRQPREQTLAAGAHIDPIRVVAAEAEAVGVGVGVGERQQARDHVQIAVAFLQHDAVGMQQVQAALAAAHADALDHQRRLPPRRHHLRRLEQHHAVRGAAEDLPAARLHQGTDLELLVGQAIVHAVGADRLARRIDPDQPAHAAQPGHAAGIDH